MKNDIIKQLYIKYYNSLMIIALSYTHDKAIAEDLVQETFLKAILSYKEGGSFLYWCNRVLKNQFYNMVRDNKHFTEITLSELNIDSGMDLLGAYIKEEEKKQLSVMIARLPIKYRQVMIDSIYLEMSDQEIANSMGMSHDNVRQIKSRAKKMLKEMRMTKDEK